MKRNLEHLGTVLIGLVVLPAVVLYELVRAPRELLKDLKCLIGYIRQ